MFEVNKEKIEKRDRFTGLFNFAVNAINPTKDWLLENKFKEASDYVTEKDVKFKVLEGDIVTEKSETVKVLRLDFYLRPLDVNNEGNTYLPNNIKCSFFIENRPRYDNTGLATWKIDKFGSIIHQKLDGSSTVQDWVDAESLRPVLVGEEEVVKFFMKLLKVPYRKELKDKVEYAIDWDMLFKGNFSKFPKLIKDLNGEPANFIGILIGVNDNGYYEFFKKEFVGEGQSATRLFKSATDSNYGFKSNFQNKLNISKFDELSAIQPDKEVEHTNVENKAIPPAELDWLNQ